MSTKAICKLLLASVVVVALLLASGLVNKPSAPTSGNNVLSLRAPPFAGVARAEMDSVASLIEDEAGISAYFQASTNINLAEVRDVFRTIEAETADYIIGSVPVTNYPESHDVHVYVHRDGWILAYYLAEDPVGKIFDWQMYWGTGHRNITTKLENTLAVVAGEAGIPFSNVTHYHFRYPNATHLMLIVEWTHGSGATGSCEVKLPGSFGFYERSWSFGTTYGGQYKLDGVEIKYHHSEHVWRTSQGTLAVSQLLPDQFHRIEVGTGHYLHADSYGGLALVYRML
jgi:hypothetical protein